MKYFALTLGIVVMSLFVSFAPVKKLTMVTVKTKTYCNHCEMCEDCKPHIVKAVEDIKGVKSVEFSVELQEVTVWFNAKKTNIDQIRDAIIHSGFAADHLAPDPAAYERLDGCCKKEGGE